MAKEDVFKLGRKPELQLVEIEGLSSAYLDRDVTFQRLLSSIKDWNAKVMSYRLGKELSSNLADARRVGEINQSLARILREVVQTRSRQE